MSNETRIRTYNLDPPKPKLQYQCSFCAKSQDQVKKLIAGGAVYICDECVELCREILAPKQEPA